MDTTDIGSCVGTLCTFLHLFLEATHTGDGSLVSPMLQTGLRLQERRGSPGAQHHRGSSWVQDSTTSAQILPLSLQLQFTETNDKYHRKDTLGRPSTGI